MKLLSDIDLSNKKVGIRLDLNVPVKNGEIQKFYVYERVKQDNE